jgi:hypothetical protein
MACGGDDTASAPQDVSAKASEPLAGGATPESGEAGEEIDANSLREAGSIEIKQYSVAYMGSGTLGKGTLIYQGREHPFRIGGLGIGGIGVASIDAHGFVYDLPDLESFTGAYGNARMGFTAADKGKGRLWLKNTNGVVLKLWTEMKGLALTGGVDGIIITWEADVQEAVAEVAEGTEEALDDTKDGSKKAWKSTKDAFR